MERLNKKIAIVTGGTKGIGFAITDLFVKEGAIVISCSRNRNDFDLSGAEFHEVDVSNGESCKKLVDYVIAKYGHIDILVNNAGIMKDRSTAKMSDEEFNSVIDTNLRGTFNMVRLIGPIMSKNGNGTIINISSFVASQGNFGQSNYVASKAGIDGMTKCWAREFSRHGENVRVNSIAPGIVLTDIFNNTPKEIIDSFAKKTALKRLADAKEIANVALFLASDESSYITGAIIPVDGGIRL